jgi:hypothetical protein
MDLRYIFDTIDNFARLYVDDAAKTTYFNQVLDDIISEKDLKIMYRSNDKLVTTAGTLIYALSDITDVSGNAITVKRVITLTNTAGNELGFKDEGNSLVLYVDPGDDTLTVTDVRFYNKLTPNIYADVKASKTTYACDIPDGNEELLIAGIKYFYENELYGQSTQAVTENYARRKQNFIADYDGSREKNKYKLSIDQTDQLWDGSKVYGV